MDKDPEIISACERNDLEKVKKILKENPKEIEARNKYLSTPLIIASAKKERLKLVKFLLDHQPPANIEAKCMGGHTPLMMAAFFGNYEALEELLIRGADPGVENDFGSTFITVAKENHREKVQEIVEICSCESVKPAKR